MARAKFAVIMAGGVGSRFWPSSRNQKPKQFLDILGTGKSLLQMTFDRLCKITSPECILVVTHKDYYALVQDQLPLISEKNILTEPERKNTAPCVLYAAHVIREISPDADMLIAPADHLILNEFQFIKDVAEGFSFLAKNNAILTMGIQASRPDTGYGYIQLNESGLISDEIYPVKRFVEKPDHNTALEYLNSGNYVWNSGMFLWNTQTILEAFDQHAHSMASLFSPFDRNNIEEVYTKCESISIDYAIMEKSNQVYVKSVDFGWSDLGTWGSLYTLLPHDKFGNSVNNDQHILVDSEDCIIHNETNQIIAIQGLKNFIIVNTQDALLICDKNDEQKIKQITAEVGIKFGNHKT